MPGRNVWAELRALRRAGNPQPRDVVRLARLAGWRYDRTKGDHDIYIKEGFWANLSIPQRGLKRKTALRLLNLIEASLVQEEGSNDDNEEG